MTVGCAAEPLGEGYKQYLEKDALWCPSCNRIFCKGHAVEHGKRLRKNKMKPMSVKP